MENMPSAFNALLPVLMLMENNPGIDYGKPGPLFHFVERFYGHGYEEELVDSLKRKPIKHTIWISFAFFYFYTNNCSKLHSSGKIPEEYNVDKDIYFSLISELMDINKALWLEFKKAGEPPWCYERDAEIGEFQRLTRWAYDELGIIPEG